MPTRLLPSPRSARSSSLTVYSWVFGWSAGITVSAKSIFRVEAGGSRQCELCEASTWPLSASATIQDLPVRPFGSTGASGPSLTCVPARPSSSPPTLDMPAGGFGCSSEVSLPSADAGLTTNVDNNAAEMTVSAVFLRAGTVENVPCEDMKIGADALTRRAYRRDSPPRAAPPDCRGDTESMKLSRPVSWFLLAFGVWSWFIWITFVKNLWKDGSGLAFDDAGDPTAYFWVHLLLAITSFLLGTAVGVIGFRGVRALRRERA